jgi:hypothetical protein
MQFGRGKPSAGAFFDSEFTTLDSLLALALLYGAQGKNECRIAAVTCSRPNLKTVGFINHVQTYYNGPSRSFSRTAPVGMRTEGNPGGTPKAYLADFDNQVKSVLDTADPNTLLRNYLQAQYDQNAFMILAGPATNLAGALASPVVTNLLKAKLKYLIVAGTPDPILKNWPTPVMVAGPDLGEALPFPDFTPEDLASPIAAAWKTWNPNVSPIPSTAVAAALYAARPKEEYFQVKSGRLSLDVSKKQAVLKAYADLVSAKPVPRLRFRSEAAAEAAKEEQAKEEQKDRR